MHQLRTVKKKSTLSIEADIKKWAAYAQCMLLQTQLHDGHKTEYILYNTWLSGDDSRDVYAQCLGLTSNTISDEVSVFGGGSSFQNVSSARRLNPLQRWEEIEGICDKQVVEQMTIAKKYFEDNPHILDINSDLLKLQH